MKRVLITGATGFVGANLARRLLGDGHEVHLLVRPGYSPWRIRSICGDVGLHTVDLVDSERLTSFVQGLRADWVFHLAAYGAYAHQTDLHRMAQTNILGTIHLVEACLSAGFEAFVNTGSSSEYGFKDHAPSEREALEPNSYYAVTKASATLFCRYTAQLRKVNLCTLRLYSVYGPYEEPTRLIPALILRGLEKEFPRLVNPEVARDYVYVDDVVEALLLTASRAPQQPGSVYNVGTGTQTSLREVVEITGRVMEIPVQPCWGTMADRLWDTAVWVSDSRKIREDLSWEPRHSYEQGFLLTIKWFRDNPEILAFYRTFSLPGR